MQQLELQASLFGLPLDQAAHDNHVAEEEQLGHRMRHVGMGAGGAPGTLGSAERRVVRIKTFPWQSMRNLTREEYMARCRARGGCLAAAWRCDGDGSASQRWLG